MSGTRVPSVEQSPSLTRMRVAAPVSAGGPFRWNEDLNFLNCYVAQPIVSAILPSLATSPLLYYVAYCKAPGVDVLRITVEANMSAAGTRPGLTCAVTSSSGSVTWLDAAGSLFLDGSNTISCDATVSLNYDQKVNYLDVSALTNGTIYDLIFTITDASGTAGVSRSLYSINVVEVPLADVDPVNAPTTEMGVNSAWLQCTDRNRIVNGTATSISYGTERLGQALEYARYQHRRHWQIIRGENTTDAWSFTTTVAGTAFQTPNPTFRMRGRALNGTATANIYTLRIRYRTSTTNKPTFRFVLTPVGGSPANTDWNLASSSGVWTATTTDSGSAAMTISIPCSGTGQECDIQLKAWNDIAGTTYVSQVALIEGES